MNKLKLCTLLMIVGFVSSCDVAKGFKEMQEKNVTIRNDIKETYGIDSQIGWNTVNNQLVSVNMTFEFSRVSDMKIEELEEIADKIVEKHFENKPKQLIVTLYKQFEE